MIQPTPTIILRSAFALLLNFAFQEPDLLNTVVMSIPFTACHSVENNGQNPKNSFRTYSFCPLWLAALQAIPQTAFEFLSVYLNFRNTLAWGRGVYFHWRRTGLKPSCVQRSIILLLTNKKGFGNTFTWYLHH